MTKRIPWLLRNESKSRLRLSRIHFKVGWSAWRIRNEPLQFRCDSRGEYGSRMPYFVANDALELLGDSVLDKFVT